MGAMKARSMHSTAMRRLLLVLACVLLAACGTATGEAPMTRSFEPEGNGPFKRFIVQYRAESAPARDKAAVPARIQRTAATLPSSSRPVLTWQRRLAVGADLFTSDRPLDRGEATALMRAFGADPDVEYIEIDKPMGVDPVRTMPTRGD